MPRIHVDVRRNRSPAQEPQREEELLTTKNPPSGEEQSQSQEARSEEARSKTQDPQSGEEQLVPRMYRIGHRQVMISNCYIRVCI